MPEPDPYASPLHPVDLPGRPAGPLPDFAGYPLPMAEVDPGEVAPPRPTALTVASWCWLVGAALAVVGLPAVFYTDTDAFAEALRQDSSPGARPNSPTAAVAAARLTPVLFAVGFAVLSVPFVLGALKLRSGRNWARVLLAVLAGPALLSGLLLLAGFASGVVRYANWLVGTAWALLFLASVILGTAAMFLPPSNDHVRRVNHG